MCARKLFAKKGFDGVSVKDVSEAAGLNISLISYHFKGKESLYRACLESFGQESLEAVTRILEPAKSFEECELRIGMFIDLMLDIFVTQPDAALMVFRESDVDALMFQDLFKSAFLAIFKNVIKFFEEVQKFGLISKTIDPHTLSSILMGSLSHFSLVDSISSKYFERSLSDPKHKLRVSQHLKKIFANGLEAKINL